jgi:aminopeptidase
VLFYNTLFDENASCHFALGKGFPDCVRGGQAMTPEELKAAGVNDSAMHVDFMIGTDDLRVVGRRSDGSELAIFEEGQWAI